MDFFSLHPGRECINSGCVVSVFCPLFRAPVDRHVHCPPPPITRHRDAALICSIAFQPVRGECVCGHYLCHSATKSVLLFLCIPHVSINTIFVHFLRPSVNGRAVVVIAHAASAGIAVECPKSAFGANKMDCSI